MDIDPGTSGNQPGTVMVAHFEYDSFGRMTASSWAAADFTYRFSTKPQDFETGLYYYGYRWYDPVTGRWPSRDPIKEQGGKNLYEFIRNNAIGNWDYIGKFPGMPRIMDPRDSGGGGLGGTGTGGDWPVAPDYNPETNDGLSYPEGAAYWVYGEGKDLHVPFSSIDPGWGIEDFIEIPCSFSNGSHYISERRGNDTFPSGFFSNAGPGNVTLTISGTLALESLGPDAYNLKRWTFSGRIYPEALNAFDFEPHDPPRPGIKEGITTLVRTIHNWTGIGDDFNVYIDGDRAVEEEGECACGMLRMTP